MRWHPCPSHPTRIELSDGGKVLAFHQLGPGGEFVRGIFGSVDVIACRPSCEEAKQWAEEFV